MNRPIRRRLAMAIVAVILGFSRSSAQSSAADDPARIDLQGTWSFQMDPTDVGIRQSWFDQRLAKSVRLPGSMQAQGFGAVPSLRTTWTGQIREEVIQMPRYAPYRDADNFKMPFWLQPKHYYVGPAWYQRHVTIPSRWANRRIVLNLERCHWFTSVWIDGHEVGQGESLSTPHVYDVSDHLPPGTHQITIRVDNRVKINVGVNSHSVTDHTQTNWNGIVGRLELRATPRVWIDDVQVYPDLASRRVRVELVLRNRLGKPANVQLTLRATSGEHRPETVTTSVRVASERVRRSIELPLGSAMKLWDEHAPNLYELNVAMTGDAADEQSVSFGMRELKTAGTQFLLNGRPIYFRGTLECCIFPETGYPPTDVESWKRIVGRCKEFGLNHMRFHSWCPPKAAFVAADELGFYLHVECASWANSGASIGDGKPLDNWLYREADRILREYGNHPSFMLLAYGNEPSGPGPRRHGETYLAAWVDHYKKEATRQLVTSAAGWPHIPENQFHLMPRPLRQHRLFNRQAPDTNKDYRETVGKNQVPLISHETGQWCVFPNLDEIACYTGILQAKNFEIVQDFLTSHGLLDQAQGFLMASGRFQTLLYKEEIEVMLRTPKFGGFQLLDLHDFPGQGTALIGVLDPFWNPKPYITGKQFRRFSGPVVPLARLASRTWTSDQTLAAEVEVAQFGNVDLQDQTVTWVLQDAGGRTLNRGNWTRIDLPRGGLRPVGHLECPLGDITRAVQLQLVVSVDNTSYSNDWDIWVYPANQATRVQPAILVAQDLDARAEAHLQSGGKLLLLPPPAAIDGDTYGSFEPIFWNRLWFPTQKVHTLGILCDPRHPALAQFPTDAHSNWQWWDLCNRSKPVILDRLPKKLAPIVQVIDDWNTCRKLGLVFESKVGEGKLLFCAIDLARELDKRPVARQLRRSLLSYMASDRFDPRATVPLASIQGLLRPLTGLRKLGATVHGSSEQPGYEAANAIDGNPQTIWHTTWGTGGAGGGRHPHELIIDLGSAQRVAGLTYLPRQDMTNGRIAKYAIYASDDGHRWGTRLHEGQWRDGSKKHVVAFSKPITTRYVKLVAMTEVNSRPFASAAEIDLIIE